MHLVQHSQTADIKFLNQEAHLADSSNKVWRKTTIFWFFRPFKAGRKKKIPNSNERSSGFIRKNWKVCNHIIFKFRTNRNMFPNFSTLEWTQEILWDNIISFLQLWFQQHLQRLMVTGRGEAFSYLLGRPSSHDRVSDAILVDGAARRSPGCPEGAVRHLWGH